MILAQQDHAIGHLVACLDVWAPAVREVVRRTAPPELNLRFAQSYDEAEQMALVEQAEFLLPGWAAVTEPMLNHAKKLRMVQKWGIGEKRPGGPSLNLLDVIHRKCIESLA